MDMTLLLEFLLVIFSFHFLSIHTMPTEKGADPMIRNLRDRDAVFMAVV
jgi:hypothetical protein